MKRKISRTLRNGTRELSLKIHAMIKRLTKLHQPKGLWISEREIDAPRSKVHGCQTSNRLSPRSTARVQVGRWTKMSAISRISLGLALVCTVQRATRVYFYDPNDFYRNKCYQLRRKSSTMCIYFHNMQYVILTATNVDYQ